MGSLLLVRHALTRIDPHAETNRWELTPAGVLAARRLATHLEQYHPTHIITSPLLKAQQTGAELARALQLPLESRAGFEEQQRGEDHYLDDRDTFVARVARIFAEPDISTDGGEAGSTARRRFETAVAQLYRDYPQATPIIVTHGRILTLLLSHHNQLDPLPFWQSLHMPELLVVDYPSFKLKSRLHLDNPT